MAKKTRRSFEIDDHIPCDNVADIRKNLFEEFDVPAKQKTSSDSSSSGREYMKVYLRVRPFSNEEIEANENQHCVEKESPTAVLMNAPKDSFAFKNSTRAGGEISHRFSFSNVFDETTTQKSSLMKRRCLWWLTLFTGKIVWCLLMELQIQER